MEEMKIGAFLIILCGFQLYTVHCQNCKLEKDVFGTIEVSTNVYNQEECWTLPVLSGHFIHIQLISINSKHSCEEDYLMITIAGTSDVYKFCSSDSNRNPIIAFGNVTITHYVSSYYSRYTSFYLKYTSKTIECLKENSFKCDDNSCVSEERVCDGVEDCKNGKDEVGCETGVLAIKGVPEAREKAVSWLKRKRTAAWGWRENTPRAIVALYLASAVRFNGTVFEEELMAKQTELKTAVALMRPTLTNSELSMFINALLVTCHSPRQFYGNNLVKRLKDQVEESSNFTHPLAYLTLCIVNESWPLKATSDLDDILNSTSEYPFVKDLQAMALMALSCEANRSRNINSDLSINTSSTLYQETIQQFKKQQALDGSFGNVHTTALITQALFSSGQEHSKDWKLNATMKYLMKELNDSSVDFLSTYLALPILNGKSLMDISYINCTANPRKHGDDPVSEISDYLGPKIRVQYSLYIGDEKDVVHTISLRVPENYTAAEVMELAEVEDPKYKFEWKKVLGKMYVFEIAKVSNDPEAGKFWLLYVGSANTSETLTHIIKDATICIRAKCHRMEMVKKLSGSLYEGSNFSYLTNCWTVLVSSNQFIRLQMTQLETNLTCEFYTWTINITGTGDVYRFCKSEVNKNPVIAFGNAIVTLNMSNPNNLMNRFELDYIIRTRECLNMNSYTCDKYTCIPEGKVCDGVKDCENGKDEEKCETGVQTIKEVPEVRKKAISWLKKERSVLWGWREDTPRAIVALYLASDATSNSTVLEEELIAKQTEFKIAAGVLKSSLTSRSILINALLVSCQNPRQFYGENLVKLLKDQVEESGNFTHPLAYLALCNANESWPLRASSDLGSILNSNSGYHFTKDFQAMAVIALSCVINHRRNINNLLSTHTLALYTKTIQHFKKLQDSDGSFGNIHTTALITQALFSSGQEHKRDWNLNATIKYLMKELESPSVDFLTTYLALPILNRKSLMDISNVNCSTHRRKNDPFEEIRDHLVPTMRLQYSLYIGDENPFVHTIQLTVKENSTASEVMKVADNMDRKFKFEWRTVSGKMYVYEIANIKNDPEVGKFWLLYVGDAKDSETLTHSMQSPDEIILADGEHLVYWYKTAMI